MLAVVLSETLEKKKQSRPAHSVKHENDSEPMSPTWQFHEHLPIQMTLHHGFETRGFALESKAAHDQVTTHHRLKSDESREAAMLNPNAREYLLHEEWAK